MQQRSQSLHYVFRSEMLIIQAAAAVTIVIVVCLSSLLSAQRTFDTTSLRTLENTDLIIVSDLLGHYENVKDNLPSANYTEQILADVKCLPKKGRRRLLFVRNYYECNYFMVQNGSLSREALSNQDIYASYFADKGDIFARCKYRNRLVDNFLYSYAQFFRKYEGEIGGVLDYSPIYRANGVYHLHATANFNVIFIKLDADITQWEAWINNILFVYKQSTGKPTLAVIFGDIHDALDTYPTSVFNEIINSGQVIAVIETNSTVENSDANRPSDSWRTIVWEKMDYTQQLFRIFVEPINATNFNLVINTKKYGFFMDPIKKLKCNYPLCYLDCNDANTYNGYCMKNMTNLIDSSDRYPRKLTTPKVFRHWTVAFRQSQGYNLNYNNKVDALLFAARQQLKSDRNRFDDPSMGFFMGRRISKEAMSTKLPTERYRRAVEQFEVMCQNKKLLPILIFFLTSRSLRCQCWPNNTLMIWQAPWSIRTGLNTGSPLNIAKSPSINYSMIRTVTIQFSSRVRLSMWP